MNTLYLIEAKFGRHGRAFIETDRDSNSRQHALGLIRSREVDPIKVLEIDEEAGTCRDVTFDEDFVQALVDACLPEIRASVFDQAARFDHARDLRKHEAV